MAEEVAGLTGLEPAISGLTGQRDNQLRYSPHGKNFENRPKNVGLYPALGL